MKDERLGTAGKEWQLPDIGTTGINAAPTWIEAAGTWEKADNRKGELPNTKATSNSTSADWAKADTAGGDCSKLHHRRPYTIKVDETDEEEATPCWRRVSTLSAKNKKTSKVCAREVDESANCFRNLAIIHDEKLEMTLDFDEEDFLMASGNPHKRPRKG